MIIFCFLDLWQWLTVLNLNRWNFLMDWFWGFWSMTSNFKWLGVWRCVTLSNKSKILWQWRRGTKISFLGDVIYEQPFMRMFLFLSGNVIENNLIFKDKAVNLLNFWGDLLKKIWESLWTSSVSCQMFTNIY